MEQTDVSQVRPRLDAADRRTQGTQTPKPRCSARPDGDAGSRSQRPEAVTGVRGLGPCGGAQAGRQAASCRVSSGRWALWRFYCCSGAARAAGWETTVRGKVFVKVGLAPGFRAGVILRFWRAFQWPGPSWAKADTGVGGEDTVDTGNG